MNSILIGALTVCVVAQVALAQYPQQYQQQHQQQQYHSKARPMYHQQQRKLAPSAQAYSAPQHQQHYQPAAPVYVPELPKQSYQSYEDQAPIQVNSYQVAKPYAAAAPAKPVYQQAAPVAYSAPKVAAPAKYEEPYYPPQPFAWGYDINDGYGGAQYHKESGDEYGKRTGSYGYTDAYGIYRQVDYVADEHGFRATIKTNEPGTSNESPADVEMHAYEPPSNYYTQQQNYQAPKAAYQAAAPVTKAAPYQPAQAYRAPAVSAYPAPAPVASYQARPQQQYQQQEYASASQVAPVYQKQQQQQVVAAAKH